MAILSFGEHLPPVYLERFNPPENQVVRISVLSTQVVGIESHWVDLPTLGIKGMYRCTGGVCCSSGGFGRRSQYYHVPVYVYTNPIVNVNGQATVNPDGLLMDWSLTKTVYDTLCTYHQKYDLTKYDLDVVKVTQGQGTRTNFTLVPDVQMRQYWTPEQTQKVNESVQAFFQIAESTLVMEATDQSYMEMLAQAGFNFETKQFPQLAAPAYHGANVAISQTIMPPAGMGRPQNSLPGAPQMGAMPTPPQMGSPIQQPQTGTPASLNTGMMPQVQSAVPSQPITGSSPQATTGTPMGSSVPPVSPAPQQSFGGVQIPQPASGVPQPAIQVQAIPVAQSTSVPPVSPQPVSTTFQQMSSVPQSAVPGNTVAAKELSAEDIDSLLGDD